MQNSNVDSHMQYCEIGYTPELGDAKKKILITLRGALVHGKYLALRTVIKSHQQKVQSCNDYNPPLYA